MRTNVFSCRGVAASVLRGAFREGTPTWLGETLVYLGVSVLFLAATAPADAGYEHGPNYGTLILVETGSIDYTLEYDDYCGLLEITACPDATVRHDGTDPVLLSVVGAFQEQTSPRVLGVTFGWTYDESLVTILDYGSCGDFELPNSNWPAPGEGTAVTFAQVQQDHLIEFYWVAAYDYYGTSAELDLIPHPTQQAFFADDSVPSILDPIAHLGSFGFFQDGDLTCPPATLEGACCFGGDDCELMLGQECVDAGGAFQGWGSDCEGCVFQIVGACCLEGGVCILVPSEDACLRQGGEFLPDHQDYCDPNPCVVVPTVTTSWGELKQVFRHGAVTRIVDEE